MSEPEVVITGLGAVTPVGLDQPSTWAALVAGRSGLGPFTTFDPAALGIAARAAAEVKAFDASTSIDRRQARRMDRVMQFGVVAAREALDDAGLLVGDGPDVVLDSAIVPPDRVGVFIGSGVGGVTTLLAEAEVLRERGARRVSPFLLPMLLIDSVPGAVAIAFGLKGPNMAHVSACASGANAIGEALELIRRGGADVMVAGGSESGIVPLIVAGFENMGALSTWAGEPTLASRPFDARRDGFVIGEGAGVLVLERRAHAEARGARIYAELVGYGSSADAMHVTAPAEDGAGILRAIEQALASAVLGPGDIDYVNAHGTSTPLNDAVESLALRTLFGRRAYDVPISSNKSMIGHLLGAGGAVEAVVTARTVQTGIIPPTINLHDPDPTCDLDYVPHVARRPSDGVRLALSNSLGFGGHNVALLIGRA
jgi:3-oxoacyl-[acyl-carrier-protein] synthase II